MTPHPQPAPEHNFAARVEAAMREFEDAVAVDNQECGHADSRIAVSRARDALRALALSGPGRAEAAGDSINPNKEDHDGAVQAMQERSGDESPDPARLRAGQPLARGVHGQAYAPWAVGCDASGRGARMEPGAEGRQEGAREVVAEPAGEGAASDEEFEKACEAIEAAYHWGDGAADAWGRLRALWAKHRRPSGEAGLRELLGRALQILRSQMPWQNNCGSMGGPCECRVCLLLKDADKFLAASPAAGGAVGKEG